MNFLSGWITNTNELYQYINQQRTTEVAYNNDSKSLAAGTLRMDCSGENPKCATALAMTSVPAA
eukprot:247076-Pelagomonas_calceolata.AAC.1